MSRLPNSGDRKPRGVVGVRELRADVSAVVAAVEGGDWFLVSKRGNPVGVLLPSAMAEDLLTQNAAEIVALQLRRPKKAGEGELMEGRTVDLHPRRPRVR